MGAVICRRGPLLSVGSPLRTLGGGPGNWPAAQPSLIASASHAPESIAGRANVPFVTRISPSTITECILPAVVASPRKPVALVHGRNIAS